MLIPPSVLIITPFRQILKGVIPKNVPRDRKIFPSFFVHFVKIAQFIICTHRTLQIMDSGKLTIISQFRDMNSFVRKIPAQQFLY